VVSETLEFLDHAKRMTKEDKEFVTPRIARPKIRQDILFAIGGRRCGRPTDVIEAYDARADRWSVVSCEHFYSYCALLNDASEKTTFPLFC
jgi:hypothetical protein